MKESSPKVVVLIPCYNEEAAIGKVVSDFRHHFYLFCKIDWSGIRLLKSSAKYAVP